MQKTLLLYLLAIIPMLCCAAGINVRGPQQVAAGQQFQLQYVVNSTDVRGFRMGNVPDAFEVIYGPSTSSQQSISIVNGRTTQSASVTYTYVLIAKKNGTFVIPAAHATVDGAAAVSQALRINVSGTAPQSHGMQGNTGGRQQQARPQRVSSSVRGNELFITTTANKTRVHEQEPILLTYKVFTNQELTQLQGKMPDLNGFHTQEIPLPQQKSFHIENYNGKPYRCVTWSQYVMFPQMSGKLTIPSITFNGIVVQEDPNVDPFEAFFNGGSGYIEVKKEIKAPSLQIDVEPLPQKPAGFSGGVGSFNISATIDKNTVKAGDPVNVRFTISGVGNLKLVRQPEIELPKDFDKYDAKVTDKTKLTNEGLTGCMIYDVLIVPRNQGSYTIPATQFIYFDTKTSQYKTLTTQPMQITVEKGSGNSSVTDYSQVNNNDIHDIMTASADREDPEHTFFGGGMYIVLNIIILCIFATLVYIFRKRALDMANVTAMRGKKANKVAAKRLKMAAKLMAAGKENAFYDEVLRALWGYMGDKLAMPVEQLSRDNVSDALAGKGIGQGVITAVIEAIDECEYARFAPKDAGNTAQDIMKKTYNKATDAITEIEESMNSRNKKSNAGAMALIAAVLICCTTAAMAAGSNFKANGDAAYRTGDYQKAIALYQKDLKMGTSAQTYYNMGNAYYRTGDLAQAIIAYERAQKMEPGNADIQHNINFVRSKTIDRLPPEADLFFVTWWKSFVSMASIDTWAMTSLCSLILALLLFMSYLFVDMMAVRKGAFFASVLMMAVFILSNICAGQRKTSLNEHDSAIIMKAEVTVRNAPEKKATEACIIHEGTKVIITDKDMKGWLGIRLSDGREGWIDEKDAEKI